MFVLSTKLRVEWLLKQGGLVRYEEVYVRVVDWRDMGRKFRV